ncbi:MAG: peptide deformylase [Frankiales bacterium]|nr:peptide deformylase [Frankiales bacterium]
MTVREVVLAPERVLSRPSADVDPCDPSVVGLAADLVATMYAHPGCVGLAAPQVGDGRRVFCLDVTGHPKARTSAGLVVLANPELVSGEGPKVGREGCQSVPDLTGDVARFRRVVVRGAVPGTGELRTYEADAFEARAFQHELDHLAGMLFLDRVAGAHAIFPRKRYL